MSNYQELKQNPPKLNVVDNPREVIFKTISCMCDNVHHITFKKNADGDFKMHGNGFNLSNWQFQYVIHDIEWEADANNWNQVINMINSGTSRISEIKSR